MTENNKAASTAKPPAKDRASHPVEVNETDVLSNQTTFFEQEVMGESPAELPVDIDPNFAEKEIARKKRKRILILAGTGSIAGLLLVVALLVLIMPEAQQRLTATPSPIPFGQTPTETALSRRLDEVEADLRAADPVKLDAPFPPVNMTTLYLDAPPR